MLTEELLLEIKSSYAETWLTHPGVISIDLTENLLRVLVQDDSIADSMPKTYLHSSGYEVGIEFMTPARLQAMEDHKAEEVAKKAALENQ